MLDFYQLTRSYVSAFIPVLDLVFQILLVEVEGSRTTSNSFNARY